ncbi:MAG: hypothetical protein E6J42_02420 [Chloroflexi bacterium]|nr:MAG: hypothetical protein E6J42_02420 [Chloroflexota bacterium]
MRPWLFLIIAISLSSSATVVSAEALEAPAGFDSSYQGESAFLTMHRGDSGQFQVFFGNTGSTTWVRPSATEVVLSVCVDTPPPQMFRCNVLSPYADWAVGWVSPRIYATTSQSVVAPGATATFAFGVKVPVDAAFGDYYFRGELTLRSAAVPLHPVGYYQLVSVIP